MTGASPATPRPQPASVPVLRRALVVGGLFVLALAVLGTVVGGIAAGGEGAIGALLGAIVGGVMVLLTAASIDRHLESAVTACVSCGDASRARGRARAPRAP